MIFRAALLMIACSSAALFAQTPSVAGLQQDVASLQDQVRQLRAEIDELRANQETLKKNLSAATPVAAGAGAQVAALEAARKADREESDHKIAALRAEVNRALAAQTKQINDALRASNPAPAVPPAPRSPKETAPAEPALPADMPKVGVPYKVRPGDSISLIAKKFNSRAEWILAANKLGSNADLKAFATIFVPRNEPSETPAE